jgi:hypothetical protein
MIECGSCSMWVTEDREVEVPYNLETGNPVMFYDIAPATAVSLIRQGAVGDCGLRTEVQTVRSCVPTFFVGSEEEALAAGWVPAEFGHTCGACVEAQTSYSSEDHTAMSGEDPLIKAAVQAIIARKEAASGQR